MVSADDGSWAAGVVLATKNNGDSRICFNYRELNKETIPDIYPLPKPDDILNALEGTKFFTELNATLGYQQVEMEPKAAKIAAYIIHDGKYKPNYLIWVLLTVWPHSSKIRI